MPALHIHIHSQVAPSKHTSQKLAKSMSVQHTEVNRDSLLQKKKCHDIQHGQRKNRGLVVFGSSELLESPPSQNFDKEKRKVNYKNIWLG